MIERFRKQTVGRPGVAGNAAKFQIAVFRLFRGKFYILLGKVKQRYVASLFRQIKGVSARTASDIQNRIARANISDPDSGR